MRRPARLHFPLRHRSRQSGRPVRSPCCRTRACTNPQAPGR
ncbi:hypothetical protein P355_1508 [Burkholderia cenocepacia KC-01]|nr:hypothetical protein P355_1508 [Burkholderia cenocepacia KC-01]